MQPAIPGESYNTFRSEKSHRSARALNVARQHLHRRYRICQDDPLGRLLRTKSTPRLHRGHASPGRKSVIGNHGMNGTTGTVERIDKERVVTYCCYCSPLARFSVFFRARVCEPPRNNCKKRNKPFTMSPPRFDGSATGDRPPRAGPAFERCWLRSAAARAAWREPPHARGGSTAAAD